MTWLPWDTPIGHAQDELRSFLSDPGTLMEPTLLLQELSLPAFLYTP